MRHPVITAYTPAPSIFASCGTKSLVQSFVDAATGWQAATKALLLVTHSTSQQVISRQLWCAGINLAKATWWWWWWDREMKRKTTSKAFLSSAEVYLRWEHFQTQRACSGCALSERRPYIKNTFLLQHCILQPPIGLFHIPLNMKCIHFSFVLASFLICFLQLTVKLIWSLPFICYKVWDFLCAKCENQTYWLY